MFTSLEIKSELWAPRVTGANQNNPDTVLSPHRALVDPIWKVDGGQTESLDPETRVYVDVCSLRFRVEVSWGDWITTSDIWKRQTKAPLYVTGAVLLYQSEFALIAVRMAIKPIRRDRY